MTTAGRGEQGLGVRAVIARPPGAILAGLFFVAATCGGTVACGRAGGDAPAGDEDGAAAEGVSAPVLVPAPAGSPAPVAAGGNPPAGSPVTGTVSGGDRSAGSPEASGADSRLRPDERPRGTPADHERYRRLRVETLRLMIEAARRELPIGPFQQRIDAAVGTALQDISEAADRMEEIVADLREAIAAADR